MHIPFTIDQFFSVFEVYNTAVFPAQVVAYVLGLIVLLLLAKPPGWTGAFIGGVLALFWIWNGAVYHLVYFSDINPAARIFGAFFILQGLLIAAAGLRRNRFVFRRPFNQDTAAGIVFILFAMLIYPLLGRYFGHRYPGAPIFGVAPCPLTIFTFGVLLASRATIDWWLILIPFLWSLIGTSAAMHLGVPQDYSLGAAGMLGTLLLIAKNRRLRRAPPRARK